MTQSDWHDPNLRTLGIWFAKQNDSGGRLLLLLNGSDTDQTFVLPIAPAEQPWIRQFDTALDSFEAKSLGIARDYRLELSSAALLEC